MDRNTADDERPSFRRAGSPLSSLNFRRDPNAQALDFREDFREVEILFNGI